MAATIIPLDGTEVAVTLNPDALASGSSRQGTVIDFTAALGGQTGASDDAEFAFMVETVAGTLGANPNVTFYIAPLATGTNFTDGMANSDLAFTAPTSPCSYMLAVVPVSAASTETHLGGVKMSVIAGGDRFTKAIIWCTNNTGLALAGTAGQSVNNKVTFRPRQWQSTP